MFPSGKMLLERFGLHQCQGSCVQPFQSKSRIHLEGASATVQQVAKHPNICRHRWNPNPKRARNSRKILCEYFCYTKRAIQSHLHESAVTPSQSVLSHPKHRAFNQLNLRLLREAYKKACKEAGEPGGSAKAEKLESLISNPTGCAASSSGRTFLELLCNDKSALAKWCRWCDELHKLVVSNTGAGKPPFDVMAHILDMKKLAKDAPSALA